MVTDQSNPKCFRSKTSSAVKEIQSMRGFDQIEMFVYVSLVMLILYLSFFFFWYLTSCNSSCAAGICCTKWYPIPIFSFPTLYGFVLAGCEILARQRQVYLFIFVPLIHFLDVPLPQPYLWHIYEILSYLGFSRGKFGLISFLQQYNTLQ